MSLLHVTLLAVVALQVACTSPTSENGKPWETPDDTPDAGSDASPDVGGLLTEREFDWCQFGFEYTGQDCSYGCEPLICECEEAHLGQFYGCWEVGCLIAADCEAVCAAGPEAYSCLGVRSCGDDDECGEGRCLTDGARSRCGGGYGWEPCVDDGDCHDGQCLAYRCSDGQIGAECFSDAHCDEGKCVGPSPADMIGFCSAGLVDQLCLVDEDCAVGFCRVIDGWFGACTTGQAGMFCEGDHHCVDPFRCVYQQCSAGAVGEPCASNEQCASGRCSAHERMAVCIEGRLGDECDEDTDCDSGHCVLGSTPTGDLRTTCRSGEIGEECNRHADCETQFCTTNPFGRDDGFCTNGQAGDPCGVDADCRDADAPICVGDQPGTCDDGAEGDRCFESTDCQSGKCEGVCVP